MIISFLPKVLGVLFCAGLIFMEPSCRRDSYEVKLSGPLSLSDQWVQLTPSSPLKADKDFQWILLDLAPPFKEDMDSEGKGPNKGKGILLLDGEVINPEIEVIDQFGNKFDFIWKGGRRGSPIYGYAPQSDGLPRDRDYRIVRIRSPKPVSLRAIYWFCDSSKDWK